MNLVAFVGKSGTGKSHRAVFVARRNNLHYIIDDGLFIRDNKILAGKSAKSEKTKVASVKRAIFLDPSYAKEVGDAIRRENPPGILIIGTSNSMVERIASVLNLGEISKYEYIEDFATPEEMQLAHDMRFHEGKHVIPVPTIELKKDFSGLFLDRLHTLLPNSKKEEIYQEKSIVRPSYSYFGSYTISNTVIEQICRYEAEKVNNVEKLLRVSLDSVHSSMIVNADVSIKYTGEPFQPVIRKVQKRILKAIDTVTSINVLSVNITLRKIVMEGKKQG